jgi:hypothetical protein
VTSREIAESAHSDEPPRPPRRRGGDAARWAIIAISYAIGAHLLYWHFGWLPRTLIPFSPTSDQSQEVWFLGWTAHAISHLQNPFFTTALNYPHGINLVTNTAMPLLGALFAPVTWLFGPLATYVLLLQLGFFASALSAAVVARRLGAGWGPAWLVGAVYGFGAQRTVSGLVHVFVAVDVVLPFVALAAIRLWQRHWSLRRFGMTVGLLLAAEFLISTEQCAIEILVLVLAGLLDLAHSRRGARARELLAAYALAAGVFIVVTCVPLWYFFFGPQSATGPPHAEDVFHLAPGQLFQPGGSGLVTLVGRSASTNSVLQGAWDNAGYVGIPLALLAIAGVVVQRRDALTRGVAVITAVTLLLSFGAAVVVPGTNVRPLDAITRHVPLLRDILPIRFAEVTVLGLAWCAAVALARLRATPFPRAAWTWAGSVLALATVVTLVPNQLVPASAALTPPFLSSAAARSLLTTDTGVLTYPYAVTIFDTPMLDQARSGLWYQLVGGQGIAPGPGGANAGIVPLAPALVFDALYRAGLADPTTPVTGFKFPVGPLPPLDAATTAAFQSFVATNHVTVVFWRWWGHHPQLALRYLEAAFGPGTSYEGGLVRVWRVTS